MSQPSPLTVVQHNAHALRDSGDLPAARAYLQRALESARPAFGEDHPEILQTAHVLAGLHREADDPMAARRVLEEALAGGDRRLGYSDPLMLTLSFELGQVAEELGNRHEARKSFGRVVAAGPAVLGEDHWQVRAAREYVGEPQPAPAPVAEPVPPASVTPSPVSPTTPNHDSTTGLHVLPAPPVSAAPPPAAEPVQQQPAYPAEPVQQQPGYPAEPVQQQRAVPAERVPHAPDHPMEPVPHQPAYPAEPVQATPGYPVEQAPLAPAYPAEPVQQTAPYPFGPGGQPEQYPALQPYPTVQPLSVPPSHPPAPTAVSSRGRGLTVAAAIAAAAAAIAATLVGLAVLADKGGSPAGPEGSPSAGPVLGGDPPTDLRLRDDGSAITVTWDDPTAGTVPFMVAGGRAGQPLNGMATIKAGETSYTVNGLSPRLDYCFTVLAVYSTDRYATSGQVCTARSTPTPR
ncbi:tetratricopeptide repeat protein [Micromonospora sp. NPDC049679]|uniref:tetratricopeptide repeat protein n=1 Tax=Micromonospora sp. NPDC049679 TaxID=3155920 RepID=UPI0033CCDE02